jgi:hypothetical protein
MDEDGLPRVHCTDTERIEVEMVVLMRCSGSDSRAPA